MRQSHTTTTRAAKPSFMSRFRSTHPRGATTTRRHGGEEVVTTTTTTRRQKAHAGTRGGLFSRRAAPVRTQRRKTSLGDKISGAMLKLKGSLTHRPGQKVCLTASVKYLPKTEANHTQAAGTRRMHGTDGRGSRRVY